MDFHIVGGFILGIAGSLHCVGMCGPLVMAIPFQQVKNKFVAYFIYGISKTLAYVSLGIIAGLLGATFRSLKVQQTVSILAGMFIIIGVFFPVFMKRFSFSGWDRLQARTNRIIGSQFQKSGLGKYGIIGFFNGLLPCGLVYAAIAVAIVQHSMYASIGYMFGFGLATMISMVTFLFLFHQFSVKARATMQKAFPVILVITGILLILRGLELGIPYISPEFTPGAKHSCCHH